MLAFRGASRYHHERFKEAFRLECEAMRLVREGAGLTNVELMLPFVRTVEEGRRVLDVMAAEGLRRGAEESDGGSDGCGGLKVHVMCEVPSNALLAREFLEHFDGLSIGSNDLTQLTLGVDRDSGILTGYDERNLAVLHLMGMAVEAARAAGKYAGICGQAPSDFPEICEFLVARGIASLSLNPDSVHRMAPVVDAAERRMEEAARSQVPALVRRAVVQEAEQPLLLQRRSAAKTGAKGERRAAAVVRRRRYTRIAAAAADKQRMRHARAGGGEAAAVGAEGSGSSGAAAVVSSSSTTVTATATTTSTTRLLLLDELGRGGTGGSGGTAGGAAATAR